jgi:hypothetical protein
MIPPASILLVAKMFPGFRPSAERSLEHFFVFVLFIVFAGAILRALFVLASGLWQPLLDMHSFRQTQTALSAYWLIRGGPWLAYETPVVGAPWSIPFEFPLYQWIVAVIGTTGLPLDGTGRLVSFGFYLATLWPIYILFRTVGLGRTAFLSTGILFMTSPLYLFWSRSFMMESCALFFSCLALGLLAGHLQDRAPWTAVSSSVAGTAATLAKATTFPAFAVVGGCLILLDLSRRLRARRALPELRLAIIPALVITTPLLIGYAWVEYSDHVKNANEFGQLLTSANLWGHNFGSLQQRLSLALWNDTIYHRVLTDLFGPAVPVALAAFGAALARPRFALSAILAGVSFLVPFLVFTNLHIAHNYYQYANGIFALAGAGIGVASIAGGRRPFQYVLAAAALIVLVVAQSDFYFSAYSNYIKKNYTQDRILRIAQLTAQHTQPDAAIIIIGDQWSSAIPYYSQRKALGLADWFPHKLLVKVFENPSAFLGNRPFGGVVYCADQLPRYKQSITAIQKFVGSRDVLAEYGDCQLLGPTQK